jgi:hypothetical protein
MDCITDHTTTITTTASCSSIFQVYFKFICTLTSIVYMVSDSSLQLVSSATTITSSNCQRDLIKYITQSSAAAGTTSNTKVSSYTTRLVLVLVIDMCTCTHILQVDVGVLMHVKY